MKLSSALSLLLIAGHAVAEDIKIKNDDLTVVIRTLGAELQSIKANDTGREYLWHGDPEHWDRRAPLMFPAVVKFKDHTYTYKNKSYEMPVLGFAHTTEFNVEAQTEDSVTLGFGSTEETLKIYPFHFHFSLTVKLDNKNIRHEFTIKNLSSAPMYYGLAGHPGFTLPLRVGETRKNYAVTFSEPLTTDRPLIIDGLIREQRVPFLDNQTSLQVDHARFEQKGGMIIKDLKAQRIGVAELGQEPFVEVDFGNFENVNIWSPGGKPFVCLEPLIGHHDLNNTSRAIEEKQGVTRLKGNTANTHIFTILIK